MPLLIISHEKTTLAQNRILSTFSGGLILSDSWKSTFYIHFIFMIYPFIVAILISFISSLSLLFNALIYALFVLLFFLCRDTLILVNNLVLKLHFRNVYPSALETISSSRSSFSDFISLVFTSNGLPDLLFRTLIYTLVSSFSFIYLNPSNLITRFGSTTGYCIYSFCWISVIIGLLPLVFKSPPAPDTYYTPKNISIPDYTRSFHITLILVVFYFELVFKSLVPINNVLYFIFALFPLLWTFGFLPEWTIFIGTLFERIHVLILAGPVISTRERFCISITISIIAAVTASVIGIYSPPLISIVICAILGCITSSSAITDTTTTLFFKSHVKEFPLLYPGVLKRNTISFIIRSIVVGGISLGCIIYSKNTSIEILNTLKSTTLHETIPSLSNGWITFPTYTLFGLLSLLIIARESSMVYYWFGLRNPTKYRAWKLFNKIIGNLGRVVYFILPFISAIYISSISIILIQSNSDVWEWILLFRGFRSGWQNVETTAFEIAILSIINMSTRDGFDGSVFGGWWGSLSIGVRLLTVSILVDAFFKIYNKSSLIVITFYHFLVCLFNLDKQEAMSRKLEMVYRNKHSIITNNDYIYNNLIDNRRTVDLIVWVTDIHSWIPTTRRTISFLETDLYCFKRLVIIRINNPEIIRIYINEISEFANLPWSNIFNPNK